MVYVYVPVFGVLFREIWYSNWVVFIRDKAAQIIKLGVFWVNYCKKHPIWSKLGVFLSKMVYWWVGNLTKYWYRESQIFKVRQAHPGTILVKVTPPPGLTHLITQLLICSLCLLICDYSQKLKFNFTVKLWCCHEWNINVCYMQHDLEWNVKFQFTPQLVKPIGLKVTVYKIKKTFIRHNHTILFS